MPREKRLQPSSEWVELSTTAADWKAADPGLLASMLGELHLIRAFEETVLELAGEGPRARPRPLQHRPGGRRGRLHRLAAVHRRGQRLAPRPPPVPGQGHHARDKGRARPGGPGDAGGPDRTAAHARRDPRARPGLLQRPRRLHAPAVVRGRGARHQRDRRRGRADGGGQRLGAEALRHRRPHGQLFRRRRGQHRLGAGKPQPDVRLAAAALLLHREQSLRRLHHRRGGHRGAAAVGACSRLRHPGLAGRWHGPARRASGDAAGAGAAPRGRGPRGHRGGRVPLLSPERSVPGQRLRLPHEGGGGHVARPRPPRSHGEGDDQARPDRRGGSRVRP